MNNLNISLIVVLIILLIYNYGNIVFAPAAILCLLALDNKTSLISGAAEPTNKFIEYDYEIPEYKYSTNQPISPAVELYRYDLMNNLITEISDIIGDFRTREKIHQYFSQLLMNVISRKTSKHAAVIELDDPLFNNCTLEDTKQFYFNLDPGYKADKIMKYKNDDFDIISKMKKIIESIHKFKPTSINYEVSIKGDETWFTIYEPHMNLKPELASQLFLKTYIVDKCRKFYKGAHLFDDMILCCLLRYITLGSAKNQYIVDLKYKEKLKSLGINFECFGSVFNRYCNNFCSMFYDLERDFGSCGSFMALKINQGAYIANPPFDETLMIDMYDHIKESLKSTKPLLFIMLIPKWEDYKLNDLIESDHLYRHKIIKTDKFYNPYNLEGRTLELAFYDFIFHNKNYKLDPKLLDLFMNQTESTRGGRERKGKKVIGKNELIPPYPFKKTFYAADSPTIMMAALKAAPLSLSKDECKPYGINFKGKLCPTDCVITIIHNETDYESFDVMGDLFSEENRLSAKLVYANRSPLDDWADPAFRARFSKIKDPRTLRDALYQNTKECTQFKPSLMVQVIKYLNTISGGKSIGKKILDFSSGWGDRMLAAIAVEADIYNGFDPNTDLIPAHKSIIDYFKVSPDNYKIEYKPFESDAVKLTNTYDLVFTSPPFFDFEIYTDKEGQSIKTYPKFNDWVIGFLFAALKKSWAQLEDGGYFVIHITDVNKVQICEAMCLFILWRLEFVKYIGCFCSVGLAGKPRPLWVFSKIKSATDVSKEAAIEFKTYYRDLYELVLKMK